MISSLIVPSYNYLALSSPRTNFLVFFPKDGLNPLSVLITHHSRKVPLVTLPPIKYFMVGRGNYNELIGLGDILPYLPLLNFDVCKWISNVVPYPDGSVLQRYRDVRYTQLQLDINLGFYIHSGLNFVSSYYLNLVIWCNWSVKLSIKHVALSTLYPIVWCIQGMSIPAKCLKIDSLDFTFNQALPS